MKRNTTNLDTVKKFLEQLMPIAELTTEIGMLLNTDEECPPREWMKKYSSHISHLYDIGDNQIVLLETPNWFVEVINDTHPSLEEIVEDEEGIIISLLENEEDDLLKESTRAFLQCDYKICVVGMSVYAEGLIATLIHKEKNWRAQIKQHAKELISRCDKGATLGERDIDELCLYVTLKRAMDVYTEDEPFCNEEPESLNRHWIAHGRVKRKLSRFDCLKMMSIVAGIIKLSRLRINSGKEV